VGGGKRGGYDEKEAYPPQPPKSVMVKPKTKKRLSQSTLPAAPPKMLQKLRAIAYVSIVFSLFFASP
jgi:hypothetical protein